MPTTVEKALAETESEVILLRPGEILYCDELQSIRTELDTSYGWQKYIRVWRGQAYAGVEGRRNAATKTASGRINVVADIPPIATS